MGANYIPEDSLFGRRSRERTEKLIKDCVKANFNCMRVWGGGVYAEDYFYDLCDSYGLIVWQDFMFACAVYELTGDFEKNITAEIEDNIRRIRNHACLGVWCGNNEMEVGWKDWGLPDNAKLRLDYLRQFEILIPEIVKKV
jgi:Beta-galactosidase/beta-glucuronidase